RRKYSNFIFCFQNKPIIAAPGDDVILPCRLDSEVDLQDFTVEWSKLDLHHDPFSFVCYYQFSRIVTEVMNKRFIQRVSLNPDGLKRGDVTLKIRNVTLQDEGKYSCFIPGKKFRETVQLLVGEFLFPLKDQTFFKNQRKQRKHDGCYELLTVTKELFESKYELLLKHS
uniref:Ig-like domain-containing protein n=1 Tax=Oryzias melastigma TaxID=30732 RepID=A0A3B3C646_ORYME